MSADQVRLTGVTKRFGPVLALDGVDFALSPGEIHALVGENGAGKSTLMRLLAGQMSADAGVLEFEGRRIDLTESPPGHRAGTGFVEQEGGLVGELTGSENLLLASPQGFRADRSGAGERLKALAEKFGGAIDPHLPVQSLAVGQRQRLEILTVLACGAKVLILDEPTAALGTDEAKALADIIRKFAVDGGAVVYISHKLAEVTELADRVTVMRRGRIVGTHRAAEVTVETLALEMVGEVGEGPDGARTTDLVRIALGRRMATHDSADAQVICELRGVDAPAPFRGESGLHGVSLKVHAGEILGIAGVVGSGQTTLAEVLAGYLRPRHGSVQYDGTVVGYMPENRHRDGVALRLSISDNLLLYSHRRSALARGPWFHRRRVVDHVSRVLERSDVRYGHVDHPMASLSGGNQQKAVVARELDEQPRMVVAHNPFRGLDVRAINDVRTALMGAADNGAAVVMISPDLDELRQLSHRIAVLFDGRIVGEVGVGDDDWERLGRLMGGVA